ncbi:MAG TPA: alkaline phosphatase D family protein [Saprospiraceae bacterium]|nr:alkaline phosphatase D family protein [Saprospiraceae bacterium]
MLFRTVFILSAILVMSDASAQCDIQSGPMTGASDLLEATVWVQTKCEQKVRMKYWETDDPKKSWLSEEVVTSSDHGYCAHLVADHVRPGTSYQYAILLDGNPARLPYPATFRTQSLWQWRTDPQDFTFVAGSCTYVNEKIYDRPGKGYGDGYEIFTHINAENPDLMIWLGDNTYLRESDWNTRTGIYHRYTHTRSLPEMQPLLASTHHYAIWDDHDYGPNDSERSFWNKDITLDAFKDFWANPNYGVGNTEGITGTFMWEDCQFFLMDDRWYRDYRLEKDYFGEKQMTWLLDALRFSQASYKFICTGGQVISDVADHENYAMFASERKSFFDSLDKYNITGVVFLTGDHHHAEVSKMTTADGDVFYDITASPLTSTPSTHRGEPNHFHVPGSDFSVRNYAVLDISGPLSDRKCKLTFKDQNGGVLYEGLIDNAKKQ